MEPVHTATSGAWVTPVNEEDRRVKAVRSHMPRAADEILIVVSAGVSPPHEAGPERGRKFPQSARQQLALGFDPHHEKASGRSDARRPCETVGWTRRVQPRPVGRQSESCRLAALPFREIDDL
jgi:hypothetical protein